MGMKVVHKQNPKTFAPLVGAKENRKKGSFEHFFLGVWVV
jgi:hypothetical protein